MEFGFSHFITIKFGNGIMKENTLYKVHNISNRRLSEMGLVRNTIFKVIKKVYGMVQLRFGSNDVVVREEVIEDITYDKTRDIR